MGNRLLSGFRVAAIATDGVEQVELLEPKAALESAGAEVKVIAPRPGRIQGFKHYDKVDQIPVDLTLERANPADFDAVLLPGGAINADALRADKKAQDFVRRIDRAGKPIAVICHGPWLLVSAGLTLGRVLTSWPTLQDDIRNSGAKWQDREVLRDGNWVSSRKPADLLAFIREMISTFAETKLRVRKAA